MKKLFLVCLMILAGSALAEWVMYAESKSNTYYFDPATIRRDGDMRRVWELQDLKTLGEGGVMSRRGRREYDCKEERFRTLAVSTHSDPMAGGETLVSGDGSKVWSDIAPGTIAETILKIVCAK